MYAKHRIGIGDRGDRGHVPPLPPPQKKLGKIFFGQISCKNSGILLIFGQISCKIRVFCSFSGKYHVKFAYIYYIFRQKCLAPQSWLSSYAYAMQHCADEQLLVAMCWPTNGSFVNSLDDGEERRRLILGELVVTGKLQSVVIQVQ